MTDNTQPEAMDLADWLEAVGGGPSAKRCAALLREQHARIAELESELEAIGAGGVSGPLMGIAAPPTAQAGGWRPIETAPKDGTHILLHAPACEHEGAPVHARTTYGHWSAPSDTPHIKYQDGFAPEPEWEDFEPFWASWDGGFTEECPPTHWMPLPPPPTSAEGVGNSGFDHQTAADFLSGKTVNDEAVRKFVAASRWAHDEKASLSATLLAMHGVLTSREAEIALLKKALLEAEAAPQQEAQEPSHRETVDVVGVRSNGEHVNLEKIAMPPRMKAREIAIEQFGSFKDDDGSDAEMCFGALEYFLEWLIRQGWSKAPQPAPDCHHRPPCDECAAIAAQGGKDA